jgi:ATP-dependent 26S proteasome regulatory subunit
MPSDESRKPPLPDALLALLSASSMEKLLHNLEAAEAPAPARADHLIYAVGEHGLDTRPVVIRLIQEADEGRRAKAQAEEDDRRPLSVETFVGRVELDGKPYAAVSNGPADAYLPCRDADIAGLSCGDCVLVDQKTARIVGRDGSLPRTGDVVTVDRAGPPGTVVVRHHEQPVAARLAHRLHAANLHALQGAQVLYDPVRKFVHDLIETESDGTELLVPPAELSKFSRQELGAPHQILDEILFRIRMWARHPEWMRTMRARSRASYLLVGPTGTGKTTHLKVVAREQSDDIERLTGQRVSRLVVCDASSFYSPWFGQTEQNINSWFDRLRRVGATRLKTVDGREINVPLLVVMEEAEALFRSRGEFGGSSHLFDRPLAQILQRLDSLTQDLDIPLIFCATTNRGDLLDAAARRRLGVRQAAFGMLSAGQAASVLAKKIPHDLPVRGGDPSGNAGVRQRVQHQVLSYLYGDDPDQGVAEVQLRNSERRRLCRRDLVTPAALEMAVSTAIDESLRQSAEAGELLGLDAEGIVRALQTYFANLASTLRPHNLREHCPDWFADEPISVESVRPLNRQSRRPRFFFVNT